MASLRIAADVASALTVEATTGGTVEITALFDKTGASAGTDADGVALVFPLATTETSEGVYQATAILPAGAYFIEAERDAVALQPIPVYAVDESLEALDKDVSRDSSFQFVATTSTEPTSLSVSMAYADGEDAGNDDDGVPINWPGQMTAVSGHAKCWWYDGDGLSFDDSGVVTATLDDGTNQSTEDVVVGSPITSFIGVHDGWEPTDDYDPASWVSVPYVRRWTRWESSQVTAKQVRELRRMAIETFINETHRWYPLWYGTMDRMKGQASTLLLPVPVALEVDGGTFPTIEIVLNVSGNETVVDTLESGDVDFVQRGASSKQPRMEMKNRLFDDGYHTRITGYFGASNVVPLDVKQCIVSLMRWHALSLGSDVDEAMDKDTLGRVTGANDRSRSRTFHETAIGHGVTGIRHIDTFLAKVRVDYHTRVFRS